MDSRAIGGEIDHFRSLGLEELRDEWRRLHHGDPPRLSRDLLILALSYRLQEIQQGGLSKATRRKLETLAKAFRTTGRVAPAPSLSMKPGARLIREWARRTHAVTVTEDGAVVERLRAFLADPGALLEALGDDQPGTTNLDKMIQRARENVRDLSAAEPQRIKALLTALACRVEVGADRLTLSLSRSHLAGLLAGGGDAEAEGAATRSDPSDRLALEAPAALRRVGREMRLLIESGDDAPAATDPSLLRLLARAEALKARLIERPTLTIPALAREENLSPAYVYSLLRLAFLAPDIAGAILAGRKPVELNAKRLMRLTPRLPPDWGGQRTMLGFG
jgi:hypothetical protein